MCLVAIKFRYFWGVYPVITQPNRKSIGAHTNLFSRKLLLLHELESSYRTKSTVTPFLRTFVTL